ncbi:hypothetical protein TNIN_273731 [Trichonephila inaurata madagascariensis]|uniref:Uncharacterized protein n=1 Tax=Trichonephila inaurata madagascariensis TaxID=2747483 RepID=A0A8X6YQN0_9ARAC|nr:hypothetical protein TNIN_273731 [Trichonephila inaurata madagascariensis]
MLTQFFLPSFGKRGPSSGRRVNECLILEPSEAICRGSTLSILLRLLNNFCTKEWCLLDDAKYPLKIPDLAPNLTPRAGAYNTR